MKKQKTTIEVQGNEINVIQIEQNDFISLTDMVKSFEGGNALIEQWLRNKDTIELLAIWEEINNPNFNSLEFEGIRNDAGTNRFYLSAKKWIDLTKAKGLIASAGRYGGTFAHKDIAFEFGSWLSPKFKLYLIKEFQRLKSSEMQQNSLEWNVSRTLSKINYRIHTDAIRENLIPAKLTPAQIQYVYALEADVLNVALFGITALQWRNANPDKDGNMRDHATLEQLVVLANLESMNALFIRQQILQSERLELLNNQAILQMKSILSVPGFKKLK